MLNTPNLKDFDVILLNTSAGKDSQAMIDKVVRLATHQGVFNRLVAVHADLGRVEWDGTKELAAEQVAAYGIDRFEIVSREQDLLNQIEQRGMFPSSSARYCTSDHKRGQVAKLITRLSKEIDGDVKILNCQGIRAQESAARAKKNPLQVNARASTKERADGSRSRLVVDWYPIFDWTHGQVWETIKESGVRHHRAYDLGMSRLSCAFCIMANRNDLLISGKANPNLLDEYVRLEKRIDHTFKKNESLLDIQTAIFNGEAENIAPAYSADMVGCSGI